MYRLATFCAFLIISAISPHQASAQVGARSDAAPHTMETARQVLSRMYHMNRMEIDLGRMAEIKGTTEKIRNYGDRLVRDHQYANKQVVDLARRMGIEIGSPQQASQTETQAMQKLRAQIDKLQALRGEAFRKNFLALMRQSHQTAIQLLSDAYAKLPEGSELRGLLGNVLPILGQHRELAVNLKTSQPQ